jgi:hypothetical protein
MKKKPGLAILFSCAALGLTLGSAGILAQIPSTGDTEAILRKTGVSRLDAETLAGGRQIVVYYDSHNAAGQAYSYHSKTSCSVSWSPKGETLKSGFDEEDAQAIPLKYDPAIDKDIEKITLLHELAHCTESAATDEKEYEADEKALAWYLQDGGSLDNAKYWIYWRAVSDRRLGVAPDLSARFLDGGPMSPKAARQAISKALTAMTDYSQETDRPSSYLAGKKGRRALIEDMLADKSLELEPDVRQILELCSRAYKFLAKGPPLDFAPFNPDLKYH